MIIIKSIKSEHITHPIEPVWDKNSKVLILGSFPSVKSRENMFFYGHPQNRFWIVTSAVFNCSLPKTIDEKKAFLHNNHIAVWDVIASCDILGSSDSSIKNAVPNDLTPIIETSRIEKIFVNGATASRLYDKLIFPFTNLKATKLPSTSPANAAWSVEALINEWKIIK